MQKSAKTFRSALYCLLTMSTAFERLLTAATLLQHNANMSFPSIERSSSCNSIMTDDAACETLVLPPLLGVPGVGGAAMEGL